MARYWDADWQGTMRLLSNPDRTFYHSAGYAPYGEIYAASANPFVPDFAGLLGDTANEVYDAAFRRYNPTQGRWLSPDPAGLAAADPTNPRSWNRYAYALNNPTTLTDPKGLDVHVRACLSQVAGSGLAGCMGVYEGGGGYSIDSGGTVPLGLLGDGGVGGPNLGGGESAVQCPGNLCSGFGMDPYTGQTAFLQFMAGAGGATGYLSGYDIALGLNEVNGTFPTNAAYHTYQLSNFLDAINSQLAAVIDALEAKGASSEQIKAFENYVSTKFASLYIEGGNVHFPSFDPEGSYSFNSFKLGCPNARCDLGALGTLDFSHPNPTPTFHLDTADPYTDVFGALVHFGVDVILGNVAYTVIPRH